MVISPNRIFFVLLEYLFSVLQTWTFVNNKICYKDGILHKFCNQFFCGLGISAVAKHYNVCQKALTVVRL